VVVLGPATFTTAKTRTFNVTTSGSPAAGTGTATQSLSLVVDQLSAFTSAATTTAVVGQSANCNVTTSRYSAPALTFAGPLPSGMSFADNGNGTATLSGNPAAGTAKTSTLKITAENAAGSATQSFSLLVTHGCRISPGERPEATPAQICPRTGNWSLRGDSNS